MGYNNWVSSLPSLFSCLILDNHLSATLCMHLFLSLKSGVWGWGVLGSFQKLSWNLKGEKRHCFVSRHS